MRIIEWNKNAAEGNGIKSTAGKANAKKLHDISVNGCKVRPEEDSFRNSLQKSMIQEEAMKEYRTESGSPGQKAAARMEQGIGQSKAESINIRMEKNTAAKGAKEVPVRKIPYKECDMVEINVLEGYVLKAKKDDGQEEGEYPVYIEKKSDDGEIKAYLFDAAGSCQDSRDEMERMAYKVMKSIRL